MRSILIGLLTLGSISSFAQNDLNAIKTQNPEASNREVLKFLYNSSRVAAELNDFDIGDDP